jgi:hypothetical protein
VSAYPNASRRFKVTDDKRKEFLFIRQRIDELHAEKILLEAEVRQWRILVNGDPEKPFKINLV